jgi:hypothetical protein
MLKKISALFLCALAGALAVGCGGSSSLSKAEFIKQGDAICLKGNKKKGAALEAFLLKSGAGPNKPLTLKQAAYETTKVLMPPIQAMAEELNELGAPAGEEAKVEAITDGVEKAVTASDDEAEAWLKNGKIGQYNDPFEDVAKLSAGYGFKNCFINF